MGLRLVNEMKMLQYNMYNGALQSVFVQMIKFMISSLDLGQVVKNIYRLSEILKRSSNVCNSHIHLKPCLLKY